MMKMKYNEAREILSLFTAVDEFQEPPEHVNDKVADAMFKRHDRDCARLDDAIMRWLRRLAREEADAAINRGV
jgi:hypothetical protein